MIWTKDITIKQFISILTAIVTKFHFTFETKLSGLQILFFVLPVLFMDFFESRQGDVNFILKWNPLVKGFVYFILLWLLVIFGKEGGERFVYFQF